ncbi:MAG TPA: hypothetical protein ENJ82_04995 [Bacteroidetes bacterium]|nr:hypothetical protein [Bacteroidota bacterium]
MLEIIQVHFPDLEDRLFQSAMNLFYELREVRGLKKRPSTSELIDWLKLLVLGKIPPHELSKVNLKTVLPPYSGALLKNEQDLEMLTSRMR